MCECRINDYYSLKLIDKEIYIFINNSKWRSVPPKKDDNPIEFNGFWVDEENPFRSYCVRYAKWSRSNYDKNSSVDDFSLLRKLARNGDKYARKEFVNRIRIKIIDNYKNDYILKVHLKDENLQLFDDADLIELLKLLNSNIKLLNYSINTKSMLLRLIPILEQHHEIEMAKKLVWKLLNKNFTILIDNDYIWDFVTEKDPTRFRCFIIKAHGLLYKREEYKKADFLKSILDSSRK